MAVGSPSIPPGKVNIPFYRDTRIIAVIVQIVFAFFGCCWNLVSLLKYDEWFTAG